MRPLFRRFAFGLNLMIVGNSLGVLINPFSSTHLRWMAWVGGIYCAGVLFSLWEDAVVVVLKKPD